MHFIRQTGSRMYFKEWTKKSQAQASLFFLNLLSQLKYSQSFVFQYILENNLQTQVWSEAKCKNAVLQQSYYHLCALTCSKRPLLLAQLTATNQGNVECPQPTQTGTATTNEWLVEHEEKSLLSDVCTSSTRAMQLAELPLILQVLKGPSTQ